MTPVPAPSFSQLWAEESEELSRLGHAVPDAGVIVDIGTAQGGSASIFHQATRGRKVAIHTYDPQPSDEAYVHLANTGVEIHRHTSTDGARDWPGPAVNLLFIDGSHHLVDVVNDYNAWAAHLASGATVAFHDYDSVERGGLIHLGVKIALDAMVARELLVEPVQVGRVLSGTVVPGQLTADDCMEAVLATAARAAALARSSYAGWTLLGEAGPLHDLLTVCLGLSDVERVDALDGSSTNRVLVFRRPLEPIPDGAVPVDNLMLCYLLERALTQRRSAVLEMTSNRRAFFKWEEVLATLDHATDAALSMAERFARLPSMPSLATLSAFIALEQVRLVCLARMLHSVTDYEA